jgi:hypothetical protein
MSALDFFSELPSRLGKNLTPMYHIGTCAAQVKVVGVRFFSAGSEKFNADVNQLTCAAQIFSLVCVGWLRKSYTATW